MPSYKFRLAASLLRRDMHDLKVKVKHRLSSAKSASNSSSTVPEHLLRAIDEPVEPHNVGMVETEAQKVDVPSTLYQVLEGRLKALYASRDRTMSHQDRFRFHGSWLVLWTALQACPSNESFDIFREKLPESAHISELLRVYDSAPTTPSPHQKVSKMPAAPYEGVTQRLRVDSAVSYVVDAAPGTLKPTTSQLWYGILEGASDASKTALIAEDLLECIWPGENAVDILDAIGHPGKNFGGEDELRSQLRNLLFPGYNDLVARPRS
ncbi:hypothetical protein FB567DRAFT_561185 [Paraphoma chrysanthemicola]|uniref:Uncharacterized protein n=1 Tax=Paraphoma chrysanthemicola TaxID=798071 RepID=A0A8K0R5Z6_9PLEO|nr:hypothetical protein FB567DRAFT_561185 [Paraphoma chrysanthemicola]